MMTVPENIIDRKREKKIEIDEKYSKKLSGILSHIVSEDEIKDTSELANNYDTTDFSPSGFIINNSTFTSAFHLVIIHAAQIGILLFSDKEFRSSTVFIIIEVVLAVAAIAGWSILLNRNPKIKIDPSSINILFDNVEIEWDNLIATHVKSSYTPKNQYDHLVINFYQPYSDSFIEKEIDLTYLDVTKWTLAAAIEYYKKLHTTNGLAKNWQT